MGCESGSAFGDEADSPCLFEVSSGLGGGAGGDSPYGCCAEVSARLKLRFLFCLVFIFSSLSLSKSGLLGFSFRFRSLDLDLSLWFQSISDVVVLGYPCLCASYGFVLHPLSHLMFVI